MVRNSTYEVKIGNVTIGGSNKIAIQSMCNIKTEKVDEVVKQIHELENEGCDIIRVSVLDENDAYAIKDIVSLKRAIFSQLLSCFGVISPFLPSDSKKTSFLYA